MYDSDESILSIQPQIRLNKNFIFNKMKYPVDFNIFKQYSNYFFENQDKYDLINDIELTEENIEITNDDFQNFVLCCQNRKFKLTNANVMPLYQLSTKYDVPDLIKIIKEYISKNGKNLVFETIKFKQSSQFQADFKDEESIIASSFFKYINNKQMFLLPISSLYRILNDYDLNLNKMDQSEQNKVIEFLFKCLDKYGKEASILFSNLNLENQRIDLYSKLANKYSNVFDFNFIDPKFLLNTTNDLLSELNKLKMEITKNYQIQNLQFEDQMKKIDQLNKNLEDRINSYDQFKIEMKIQLDNQKQNYEIKLRQLFESFNDLLNKNTNMMNLYITKNILLLLYQVSFIYY